MILAHAVSDDEDRLEVYFDAEPWFNQASSTELLRLKDEEYCMCELCDAVFRWTEAFTKDRIEKREIKKFFRWVCASDSGYEVYIDENDVNHWRWRRDVKPALDAVDDMLGQ